MSRSGESAATGQAAALAAAPRRAPLPATRWIYREINCYNGMALGDLEIEVVSALPLILRHTRVRRTGNAGSIAAPDGPLEARYSEPWSVLIDPWFDQGLRFAAPVPLLPPTLQVGARIDTATHFTLDGQSGNYGWQQRLQVIRTETLATPAGRFDCVVLERDIRFESPDPFSFDRQRRETRWYAPTIDGWVRHEWTGDYLERGHLDDRFGRRREDWLRLELQAYMPAPIGSAGGQHRDRP